MEDDAKLICPAGGPGDPEAQVIAVYVKDQRVPINPPIPVTQEIIDKCAPKTPRQILQITTPCWKYPQYWSTTAERCTLIDGRLANFIPETVETRPPPCVKRAVCRWWHQRGAEACRICTVIPTDVGELPQDRDSEKDVSYI